MTTTGNNRLIRVQMPTIYQNGEDVRMGDNLYSLNADVQVGAINPSVQTNSENNVFLTSDDVELVGRFNAIASQPLNYTWREGFYVWGHGQVLNRTGEAFGLGHHNLTLQVTDHVASELICREEDCTIRAPHLCQRHAPKPQRVERVVSV